MFLSQTDEQLQLRHRVFFEKGRPLDPIVSALMNLPIQKNFRLDAYGSIICWEEYGNRQSKHGWELDHHPIPKSLGGFDTFENLRPLSCQANATLGGLLGANMSTK